MPSRQAKSGPLAKPSEAHAVRLDKILRLLAPDRSDLVTEATERIRESVNDYLHRFPQIEEKRRVVRTRETTRREIEQLLSQLAEVHSTINDFSVDALNEFCLEFGPLGQLSQPISSAIRAAKLTLENRFRKRSTREDPARVVLAADVAKTLKEVLGIRISATPHGGDSTVTGKHGGAAYSRVLGIVLGLAGLREPNSMKHLMKQAMAHLDNEFGNTLT